jgi:hypothetical protein
VLNSITVPMLVIGITSVSAISAAPIVHHLRVSRKYFARVRPPPLPHWGEGRHNRLSPIFSHTCVRVRVFTYVPRVVATCRSHSTARSMFPSQHPQTSGIPSDLTGPTALKNLPPPSQTLRFYSPNLLEGRTYSIRLWNSRSSPTIWEMPRSS